MEEKVKKAFAASIAVKRDFQINESGMVARAAAVLIQVIEKGNKILFVGNGGSAADSQHAAAELVNRFLRERRAIPALALTTDTSVITSIANDRDYDSVFSRQVEALAQAGDALVAISTSGGSGNVLSAVDTARAMGLPVIGLTGGDGDRMRDRVDVLINVASTDTPRIQEVHITVLHILCDLIEEAVTNGTR